MGTLLTVLLFIAVVVALAFLYWTLLSFALARPIGADEVYEVTTPDLWQVHLYRFMPDEGKGPGEPVFLCHGLMSNHLNFTSPRGASLVDALVERGYDCWLIDLRGCRSCTPPYEWSRFAGNPDDYILRDIPAVLDLIRSRTGYGRVHWVGHSMGGMMLYAYELVQGREWLASGVTLGAPPGFEGLRLRRPRVTLMLMKLWPQGVEWVLRGSAPLFSLLKPRSCFVPVNWLNMHSEVTASTFFNMLECPPPAVARAAAEWAATNEWRMGRENEDIASRLNEFCTPLLAMFGAGDPLVPLETARAFMDSIQSEDKKMVVLSANEGYSADYNHVDIVFGRNAKSEVYQEIADWLERHSIDERVKQGQEVEMAFRVERLHPRAADAVLERPRRSAGASDQPPSRPKQQAAKKSTRKKPTADKKAAVKGKATAKRRGTSAKSTARKKSAPKKKSAAKKKGPAPDAPSGAAEPGD